MLNCNLAVHQPGRNHFELFGQPAAFGINLAALDASYRRLQREVHPDRFATAPDDERRRSMQLATMANEAYRTLKDPLARARYLLALAGVDPQLETSTAMPAEFLMRQIEWREALEEGAANRDVAGLDALEQELGAEMDQGLARIEAQFGNGDAEGAAKTLRQLMFLKKLRDEISLAQESLDD